MQQAPIHEPAARHRAWMFQQQMEAERQRHQALAEAQARRMRQRRTRRVVAAVPTLLVLAVTAFVVTHFDEEVGTHSKSPVWGMGGDALRPGERSGIEVGRPTARAAKSKKPLGTPAPLPLNSPTSGSYAFLALQNHTARPVAYDPCRPIQVVVNDQGAPPQASDLVRESLQTMSRYTGLKFVIEGATDEAPEWPRSPFQPKKYGDRWAPVLIAWTTPAQVQELAGDVIGLGGSVPVGIGDEGDRVYVSGQIALDGPDIADLLKRPNGYIYAKAAIMHEVGHLVGLAHVEDLSQLMNPRGQIGVYGPQDGDRHGLAIEGQGTCYPKV